MSGLYCNYTHGLTPRSVHMCTHTHLAPIDSRLPKGETFLTMSDIPTVQLGGPKTTRATAGAARLVSKKAL